MGGGIAGEDSPVIDRIAFAEILSGQSLTHSSPYFLMPDMINGAVQQFTSETSLSTVGAVEVVSGANLSLFAAQSLGLSRGFTVQSGGELSLEVAAVICN